MSKQFQRILQTCIFLFLLIPASWASKGWQPLTETIHKSADDPRQYQAVKLINGITVLLISDVMAPKSLAALALPVGFLEDPNTQLGLAHYAEHMVLQGSQRFPESDDFANFLKKHGGSYNASTASYRTGYYLEVENKALTPAVERLADAIAAPLFKPINADRERHAVHAEASMARSSDGIRMWLIDGETLNPAHPFARFPIGNLDTLQDKPDSKLQDELIKFHQRYYSANIMVAVLYSNQSLAKLAELAANTFGKISNRNVEVPLITVPVATSEQTGIIIHTVPAQPRKQLKIDFRIDNNSAAFRSKTDDYISYLISNTSDNTLSDWLQKQGLADAIKAEVDPMSARNGGVFTIEVSLTDKGLAQRDKIIAAIFNYLNLLHKNGIKKSYFDEMARMLNLDFRYLSVTRDMNYIHELVDMMLRVPVTHVLDAPYLADRFDPEAITARLAEMTPEKARIWFISPEEPHNKVAYFLNAPYQVDKMSTQQLTNWKQLANDLTFSLPTLNPYIANDFSLIENKKSGIVHPHKILDEPGLRVFHMPSQYFANEPKADISIAFRFEAAQNSARHQVLFALTHYLANRSLNQLRTQADVGGIQFSIGSNQGLYINAHGFTQRLPNLLLTLLKQYSAFTPTKEQLEQAKSYYREQLEINEKRRAFELAIYPVKMLSQVPYTERAERQKTLDHISVQDIVNYRNDLLQRAAVEILAIGNILPQQVNVLAQSLKKQLAFNGTTWSIEKDIVIDKTQLANLERISGSTDTALAAVYVPIGYSEIESKAYSHLLTQIIHPWFFEQLRTQEQLGYAVFSAPIVIGKQWGVGFILQSSSKQPDYLYQRYLAFYPQILKRLEEMTPADFSQYQQGLINTLQQRPQTLAEEANRYESDFNRHRFTFDHRHNMIEQVKKLNQKSLVNYFQQAVIKPQGLALLSQVKSQEPALLKNGDYATMTEWITYPTISALQATMPRVTPPAGSPQTSH